MAKSGWRKVAETVSQAAPLLGGLIGGPVGSAAGTAVKMVAGALGVEGEPTPDVIEMALQSDPAALAKIRELEITHKTELTRLMLTAETAQIEAVNATMRAESQSEHWPQYTWRPFWGFISGAAFFVVCVFVCVLAYRAIIEQDAMAVGQIPVIIGAFTTLFAIPGAILGVSAWGRNKLKELEVQQKDQKNH